MLLQRPRTVIPEIAFPALPDRNAAVILAIQRQLDATQWLPESEMQLLQFEQIKLLLDHALRTVPYYKQLFAEHGLTVPAQPDMEFLRKIPVLTRPRIQQAGATLQSTQLPAHHGPITVARTSGSTGQPVEIHRTTMTALFQQVFVLRDHVWHQRDFLQKFGAIRWYKRSAGNAVQDARPQGWGGVVSMIAESGPAVRLHVSVPLQQQIQWLLDEQPYYLLSFPSNLAALATHCLQHSVELPGIHELRTVGETLTLEQRELYSRAWHINTVDVYSCEEVGYLALQCSQHTHYHVQSENVLLEIVDEHDQPCAPGQIGRVLVTSLNNYATPLIRYEVGDMATFGPPCDCGRGLAVITQVFGRKRNRLIMPDGRSEFPYLGEHGGIKGLTGLEVHAFQCVQHTTDEVEFKLVLDRPFSEEETQKVTQLMQNNLGHPFRIRFSYHESLPKGPTGKFEEFVSLVTL